MFESDEVLEATILVDYNGQKSVRVTQTLSDLYLQAFSRMETHTNTVKKANAFIETLKNPKLASQPLRVLKALHHMPDKYRGEFNEDAYRGLAELLQESKIMGFSALNFTMKKPPFPEFGTAEIPSIILSMTITEDAEKQAFGLPLIYYKGKWGFGKYWPD